MRLSAVLSLAAILLLLPAAGDDPSAEVVASFKRFYASAKQPRDRYEAVLVLKDVNTPLAADALLAPLQDDDFGVRTAAIETLGGYKREDIAHWIVDTVLTDKKIGKKPLLRAGCIEVLGLMGWNFGYAPAADALKEKDVGLKLAAITTLGRLHNKEACPALSQVAADPDGALALAALDALSQIGSAEGAQDAVVGAFKHADWRVRARAIEAVVKLRIKAGVGPLIEAYANEDGRLRGDAIEALRTSTCWDLGDNPDDWRKWWADHEATFVMPDPEKVAEALAKAKSSGETRMAVKKAPGEKQFLTVSTRSESMVFVIDVSGSMDIPFGDPERLKMTGRTYPSLQRLAIVKEELKSTITDLPETTSFNIMAFATDVRPWKKDPVKANVLNKAAAIDWVNKLHPLGLNTGGTPFDVQVGQAKLENSEGATNTFLALMTALGVPEQGLGGTSSGNAKPKVSTGSGPGGAVGFETQTPLHNAYDTIFFLTDGEPTVGKTVDMFEIRREVRRVNQYRGVQIHVIYVGEVGGNEMADLAHENGGVFVKIGG
jgi:HEAT repeat protein